MKYAVILVQICISAFFIFFTLMMFGPFLEGPIKSKIIVPVIILTPLLSIYIAFILRQKPRESLAIIALILMVQLALVFVGPLI